MTIKTLGDIVNWTREFHQQLAECTEHCSQENKNERAQMMLTYLSQHEARLSEVVAGFEKLGQKKVLETWTNEYFNLHPILARESCDAPFSEMRSDDIVDSILSQHEEIIELYKFLEDRAEISSVRDLMKLLRELEHNEVLLMVQAINRFADM